MKKIYSKFVICLLLGAITYWAALNFITYNTLLLFEMSGSNIVIGLGVILSGLVCFIFSWLFSNLAKKNISKMDIDDEKRKKLKKKIIILCIINLLVYSVLAIIWSVYLFKNILQLTNKMDEWMTNYNWGNEYSEYTLFNPILLLFMNMKKYIFLYFIVLIFSIIPFFKILRTRKEIKFIKILSNIVLSVLLLFVVMVNIYYIDIPEFNYIYGFQKYNYDLYVTTEDTLAAKYNEGNNESIAWVGEYSDFRKIINGEDYIVPDKIWGRKVDKAGSFYNTYNDMLYPVDKIIFTNTFDGFFNYAQYGVAFNKYGSEIVISGEPINWFVEDNIVYNMDKTEMILFAPKNQETSTVHIGKEIKDLYSVITARPNTIAIDVDENNQYFYSYDNALYTKDKFMEAVNNGETKYFLGEEINNKVIYDIFCAVPLEKTELKLSSNLKEESEIFVEAFNLEKIIIPKDLNYEVDMLIPTFSDAVFEVEEGNEYYTSKGKYLYNKDMTKLISISKASLNNVYIEPTVKEISEAILNFGSNYDISPENPYIEKIEDGKIIYKE